VARYDARSLRALLSSRLREVDIRVLKEGLFYRRLYEHPRLVHKVLAVCRGPLAP
jgi:hypothetical protein